MKKLGYIILQMLSGIFPTIGKSQQATSLSDFIQKDIDSIRNREKIPGILVGINNGLTSEYYTAGYSEPDQQKPFTKETIFEAGSITKTFTAYIVLNVLRDHGLNDSISIFKFLPDDGKKNSELEKITFLQLLNHTSGLPRLPENMELRENALQPYANYNSKLLFEYLAKIKTLRSGKYEYSNLGMALAGTLCERISGSSYKELLNKYVVIPFKMNSSGLDLQLTNRSQGYISTTEKAEYWNMNVMAPAGGLLSNASDMLLYLKKITTPENNSSEDIVHKLLEPTFSIGSTLKVGRGWHISKSGNSQVYWHNGGTYGFSTFCAFSKETGQSVIIVVNQFDKNQISDALGLKIMKKMMNDK